MTMRARVWTNHRRAGAVPLGFVLAVLLAAGCSNGLPGPPDALLGVWRPASEELKDRFLEIGPSTVAWGAGEERESRSLERVERRAPAADGVASFELHFREADGSRGTLSVTLYGDGSAEVGGRSSFRWRREGAGG